MRYILKYLLYFFSFGLWPCVRSLAMEQVKGMSNVSYPEKDTC